MLNKKIMQKQNILLMISIYSSTQIPAVMSFKSPPGHQIYARMAITTPEIITLGITIGLTPINVMIIGNYFLLLHITIPAMASVAIGFYIAYKVLLSMATRKYDHKFITMCERIVSIFSGLSALICCIPLKYRLILPILSIILLGACLIVGYQNDPHFFNLLLCASLLLAAFIITFNYLGFWVWRILASLIW